MQTKEQKRGVALTLVLIAVIVVGTILLRNHRGLYIDHINEWWFGWILTRLVVPFMLPAAMPVVSLASVRLHRIGIHMKPIAVAVVLALCLAYMALGAEVYGWFSTIIFIGVFLFGCVMWGTLAYHMMPYCPNCHTGLINVKRTKSHRSEIKSTTSSNEEMYALSPDTPYQESKRSYTDILNEVKKSWKSDKTISRLRILQGEQDWVKSHPIYKNVYHLTYNHFDQFYDCTCEKCGVSFEKRHSEQELAGYEIRRSKDARPVIMEWLQKQIKSEMDTIDRETEMNSQSKPEKTLGSILKGGVSDLYEEVTGQTEYVAERHGKTWTGQDNYVIRKRGIWDTMRNDVRPVKKSNRFLDFFWPD